MKSDFIYTLSLKKLLELPLADLPISIEGSVIEKRLAVVYLELEAKKLLFRPHVWVSEEWFTPDDIPGFAIPFYLLHPRLLKLEKRQMFEAEGANKIECLKILRHETGHAIAHAFKLYNQKRFSRVFGNFRKSYPLWYVPNIQSKNYVTHLNSWYAQAHPIEDFAETFAVWLNPQSEWETNFKDWPAIEKLYYVNELMTTLQNRSPLNNSRKSYAPLSSLFHTINEHYKQKKRFYTIAWPQTLDQSLHKIFSTTRSAESLNLFFRQRKNRLREIVSSVLDLPQYSIEQITIGIKNRCKELGLRSTPDPEQSEKQLIALISSHLTNSIHTGYHRIPL